MLVQGTWPHLLLLLLTQLVCCCCWVQERHDESDAVGCQSRGHTCNAQHSMHSTRESAFKAARAAKGNNASRADGS